MLYYYIQIVVLFVYIIKLIYDYVINMKIEYTKDRGFNKKVRSCSGY